jgi:hypothetical protein
VVPLPKNSLFHDSHQLKSVLRWVEEMEYHNESFESQAECLIEEKVFATDRFRHQ